MNPSRSRRIVLVIASISSFLTPFMGSSINVALPSIGREFSLNALTLNWVSTSYLIASAMFLLPISRAADIYGRKRFFIAGITIFTLSSFLIALCPSASTLIAFRVLQGFGSSMIFGTGVAILTEAYHPQERGKALGINTAAVYLGLSLGPFLGGILTGRFGWQSIFLVNVPLGLAVLLLAVKGIRADRGQEGPRKIDAPGSLLYSCSLVAVMYGFSLIPKSHGLGLVAAGILGVLLFIAWEKRAQSPVLDVTLLTGNRQFAFSNLATFIHYSATFAITFLMSLYLQYIKGLSAQEAGLVLVCQPLVMMVLSPVTGRLSDRIDPRLLASLGMAVTSLGIFLLVFLQENTGLVQILASLFTIGVGFAFFSSPNTNAVMSSVEKGRYGVAAGVLATMRLTGQMASMGIALMLFAVFIGQSRIMPGIYPEFMKAMKTGFMIFSALCVAGVFASLARGRVQGTDAPAGRG